MIVDLTRRGKEGRVVTVDIPRKVNDLPVFAVMHIIGEVTDIQNMQLLHLPLRQGVIQSEVEGLLQGCIIIFKALSHGPKELSKGPWFSFCFRFELFSFKIVIQSFLQIYLSILFSVRQVFANISVHHCEALQFKTVTAESASCLFSLFYKSTLFCW